MIFGLGVSMFPERLTQNQPLTHTGVGGFFFSARFRPGFEENSSISIVEPDLTKRFARNCPKGKPLLSLTKLVLRRMQAH